MECWECATVITQISEEELQVLLALQQSEYQNFKQQPEKAEGWLSAGAYQLKKDMDRVGVAANTVVASTIINADVTIMKR